MRKTKIVCTIGPASEHIEILCQLIQKGMNVARLNFSHGSHEEHAIRIQNIRKKKKKMNQVVAILLDTKGPEIRTHDFIHGEETLEAGSKVIISMLPVSGTKEKFSVTYPDLIHDVQTGSRILLDDGLIELEVTEKRENEIVARVLNSGVIKNKKGVNIPNVKIGLPGITEKDKEDILFGIKQGVDFIAASFVRKPSDVLEIRNLLEDHGGEYIQIIPKIENREGILNLDGILEVSDGLMVARGDLGVEIPAEEVPIVQKEMIRKCNRVGKPVITATQMLDSMQRNPRPTRAEASDVANAIFDGTDAVMLSGETAAGQYPVQAVETMHQIAMKTEESTEFKEKMERNLKYKTENITDAIGISVTQTVRSLPIQCILTPTQGGHTAKMIAKYRPAASILAIASSEHIMRSLMLVWGVIPALGPDIKTTDEMLDFAVEKGLDTKMVRPGDLVVITAGVPIGESGTTNLMKIHYVGDILAKGQGIGRQSAFGKVVIAYDAKDANKNVTADSILVTPGTDKEMMPAIEKACAIVTEEGGLTSHAAIIGVSLGKPVIVGVKDALTILQEGMDVTVDSPRGYILSGHTNVL